MHWILNLLQSPHGYGDSLFIFQLYVVIDSVLYAKRKGALFNLVIIDLFTYLLNQLIL